MIEMTRAGYLFRRCLCVGRSCARFLCPRCLCAQCPMSYSAGCFTIRSHCLRWLCARCLCSWCISGVSVLYVCVYNVCLQDIYPRCLCIRWLCGGCGCVASLCVNAQIWNVWLQNVCDKCLFAKCFCGLNIFLCDGIFCPHCLCEGSPYAEWLSSVRVSQGFLRWMNVYWITVWRM